MRRSTDLAPILAVVLGLGLSAIFVSCAGQASKDATSAPPEYTTVPDRDTKTDEIRELWMQIRDWRRQMGMSLDPERGHVIEMRSQPLSSAMRICPADYEPVTAECQDVCSLANAICENADNICRIADDLPDDVWARDKCDSAKASCKEAKERCCDCENGHGGGGPDAGSGSQHNWLRRGF